MALNDYVSGTKWSNHDVPTADQTNPNNDPEIAASQERLRAIASFDFSQATPTTGEWRQRAGGGYNGQTKGDAGESEQGKEWVRDIIYDTPGGRVVGEQVEPANAVNGAVGPPPSKDAPPPPASELSLRSEEKYWWKPGLAETFSAQIGADGKVTNVTPRDTRYSLGEQLADAAGSVVTLGALGLASYGVAAGVGAGLTAAGGTAAGATGANTLTAAEIASINSAGVVESGSLAAGGYTMPAAGVGTAAEAGVIASEAAPAVNSVEALQAAEAASAATPVATNSAAAPAADIFSGANSAANASAYEGMTGGSNWWTQFSNSDWGKFANSEWGKRLGGAVISGVGSAISSERARSAAREDRDNERAYRTRNLNANSISKINWGSVQPPKSNYKAPLNPFSPGIGPQTASNTPRLAPGPIPTPIIDNATDIYNRR